MNDTVPTTGDLDAEARHAYESHLPVKARDPALSSLLEETLRTHGSLTRLKLGLIAGRATRLPDKATVPLATAFEYFHTASLLLDDLPCMDNASRRRGRPCAHVAHGEATAIMAALAFINRGYALAWSALSTAPSETRQLAAGHIEKCLGDAGVLDGQCMDLHFADSDRTARTVARTAVGKTVSLLRLVLVAPALMAGASKDERLLLSRLAVYWGLAYQIADDCSDFCRGGVAGKTPGRDALLDRPNHLLAAGAVATLHRLHRLLSLTNNTLVELVHLEPDWARLEPLVTRLIASSGRSTADMPATDLRCA